MWTPRDSAEGLSAAEFDEEETPLWRLVYVSEARDDLTDDDLDRILESALRRNSSLDVTGMLMFVGGRFRQILEGTFESVNDVFSRIELDRRHSNIDVLENQPIARRSFPDWTMGPPSRNLRQLSNSAEADGFLRGVDGPTARPEPETRRLIDLVLAGIHPRR